MRDSRFLIILVVISVFLFLFGLEKMPLTDPDETFYAQTAKEMFNANEWITPSIFGEPQFEKPVLYYWLIILSYIVFGVGEFAARFPSALFGIAGVIGIYFFGRLLFSPLCGFLSGLILAACTQYLILARSCVTDMVLTVFILFCLLFFLQGWISKKNIHYYMASFMAALAVLTKGPIGLFIPGLVIILYILITRQWKELKGVPIARCILLFMAVSLPWYIIAAQIHGDVFINDFFGFHNVTRFLKPEHRIGDSPFFYIPVIIGGFFPWIFFLPAGIWDMYKSGKNVSVVKGYRLFLMVWFLVVFVFFTVSRTKLVTYIFPLFPLLAIVVGRFWEKFLSNTKDDNKLWRYMKPSYIIFVILSFLTVIGISFFVRSKYSQAFMETIIAGACFSAGLILSIILFLRNKRFLSFLSIVFTILILLVPLVRYVLPIVGHLESSKAISYKMKELAGPDDLIAGEDDARRGVAFYSDRIDIEDIHGYNKMIRFISQEKRVWGIIKRKHYDNLKKVRPEDISDPIFEQGKKVLFTNKPLNK